MWVSQTRHGFLGPPSVRSASSSTRLFNELPLAFALRYHLELEARRSSEPSSVPRFRQAGLALGPRRVILPSRPRYLRSIVRPSSSVTPQVFFMLTKEAAAGSLRGWPHAGFSFPACCRARYPSHVWVHDRLQSLLSGVERSLEVG